MAEWMLSSSTPSLFAVARLLFRPSATRIRSVYQLYAISTELSLMKERIGILVTTSDYGPDAYAFAKDKPISLLSGSNLLHLLEKHGQRAKIDIAEAREQLRYD